MKSNFFELANLIPTKHVNPSESDLQSWTNNSRIENEYGLPIFKTNVTARSAKFTTILSRNQLDNGMQELEDVFSFVKPEEFLLIKIRVGEDPSISLRASVIVSKKNANKALMLTRNFFQSNHEVEDSDILTLDVPQYPERRVFVDPHNRMTYVLGIDYYGEMKMSVLRMAMEIMREDKQGLGLHAGSKTFILNNKGVIQRKGALIFGLSGTGKTTLTCHDHGFTSPEGVVILQDDINLITQMGNSYGSEKGFYVKCDACPEHKQITDAVLAEKSVLENVHVDENGKINWKNFDHTYNSRAVVDRSSLKGTDETIDLPSLDFILFNTRRPELPPIGRLTSPAQGAVYYGLGESIITSAEDPNRVGESKRQVGFDPFIIGNESLNINRMKNIIESRPELQCFVVNTGYVGDESNDITIPITLSCIEQAIRGDIDWIFDETLGYEIPKDVKGFNYQDFLPHNYYGKEKYAIIMKELKMERNDHLSQFSSILPEIVNSL